MSSSTFPSSSLSSSSSSSSSSPLSTLLSSSSTINIRPTTPTPSKTKPHSHLSSTSFSSSSFSSSSKTTTTTTPAQTSSSILSHAHTNNTTNTIHTVTYNGKHVKSDNTATNKKMTYNVNKMLDICLNSAASTSAIESTLSTSSSSSLSPSSKSEFKNAYIEKLKSIDKANDILFQQQYASNLFEFNNKLNRILPISTKDQVHRIDTLKQILDHWNLLLHSKDSLQAYFAEHGSIDNSIQISYEHQSDFVELLNHLTELVNKSNYMLETLCSEIQVDIPNDNVSNRLDEFEEEFN